MSTPLPPIPAWLDIPAGQRATAMALQFQLQQTQYAAPDAMAELQFGMLQRLFAHAVREVPFYRERHGQGAQLRDWAQWRQLPVLTRAEIQAAGKRMVSARLPTEQGRTQTIRSSGSTGRPIEVVKSERAGIIHSAISHRDHLWHRRNLAGRLAVIKRVFSGSAAWPGSHEADWGDGSSVMFANGPCFGLDSNEPTETQFRFLQERRPDYLLTYASLIPELARLNDAAGRPLRLSGITSFGEMLSPAQREAGESSFRCRIIDLYSAQETGYLALQCPMHTHFHVQSENCLVEILDDDNKPCAPGQPGRVVVTPLHNLAQPLLRYANGDYAVPGEPCNCGIRLPVLSRVLGRTRNLILMPDGSRHWPALSPRLLLQAFPDAQYQFVQQTRNDILVRVATRLDMTGERVSTVVAMLREQLGAFNFRVERVDNVPRGPGGKFEEFICEVAG